MWSYDFVKAMTHDGRSLRLLVLIDEYTRECLAIRVARRLGSREVIETLGDVMLWRGIPEYMRTKPNLRNRLTPFRTWFPFGPLSLAGRARLRSLRSQN